MSLSRDRDRVMRFFFLPLSRMRLINAWKENEKIKVKVEGVEEANLKKDVSSSFSLSLPAVFIGPVAYFFDFFWEIWKRINKASVQDFTAVELFFFALLFFSFDVERKMSIVLFFSLICFIVALHVLFIIFFVCAITINCLWASR